MARELKSYEKCCRNCKRGRTDSSYGGEKCNTRFRYKDYPKEKDFSKYGPNAYVTVFFCDNYIQGRYMEDWTESEWYGLMNGMKIIKLSR